MQGRVGSQEGRQGRAQQHRDVEQDTCSVKQQAQEGPVVAESHAAAQQAAVVIPTKDAHAAGGTMPTARGHLALALVAVTAGKEPQRQFRQQLGVRPIMPAQPRSLPWGNRHSHYPNSLNPIIHKRGPDTPSWALPARALKVPGLLQLGQPSLKAFLWPPASGNQLLTSSVVITLVQVTRNSPLDYCIRFLTSLPD